MLAMLPLSGATAQTDAHRVSAPGGQIATPPGDATAIVSQIAPQAHTPVLPAEPEAAPSERAYAPGDMPPVAPAPVEPLLQIGTPAQGRSAMPQLSGRDPSTQTGQRPATPAERRDIRAAPLAGTDRCDPRGKDAANPRCRNVIETRADSFTQDRPELSPEQRLLAERRPGDEARTVLAEVRRVGRNDSDPNSTEAQTLAAILQAQQGLEQAAAAAAEQDSKAAATVPAEIIESIRAIGQ